MSIIEVEGLVKEYLVLKKKKGLRGSLSSLIKPDRTIVRAVDGISFTIGRGEIVGYIGPNGAGKSTTVKMLSGILQPTSGLIKINNISPQENRKAVVKGLGVVFGQRTQLYWDLRLGESFELLRRIYCIEASLFKNNLKVMNEVLKINDFIDIPVRQLSLGQRMRGDLAAAMLHSPSILFLDEPTIGLDVEAKYSIREFIKDINKRWETTVILTTHDLDDVEQLCHRLMVINDGKIVEDGPLQALVDKLAPYRLLMVDFINPPENLSHPAAEVIKIEGLRAWLRFEKSRITAAELIAGLSAKYPVRDISVKEADIEDMIRELYRNTSRVDVKSQAAGS